LENKTCPDCDEIVAASGDYQLALHRNGHRCKSAQAKKANAEKRVQKVVARQTNEVDSLSARRDALKEEIAILELDKKLKVEAAQSEAVESAKETLAEFQSRIDQVRTELSSLLDQKSRLESEVALMKKEWGDLVQMKQHLDTHRSDTDGELSRLRALEGGLWKILPLIRDLVEFQYPPPGTSYEVSEWLKTFES
jgi:chromosome segregation ATPase